MEYLISALIPIIAVAVVVVVARRIASHSFKCKQCSKEFHIKWYNVFTATHYNDDYMLTCPHCNVKGWCEMQSK